MKKFLALFLALITVVGLCACGGGGSGGQGSGGENAFTIGHGSDALITDMKDNALTKWVEEQCGVELSFIEYAGGTDIGTQISTTIAANQTLPNILMGMHSISADQRNKYGRDGYFVDLTKYYEDRDGASKVWWDRLEESYTQDEIDDILTQMRDPETGKIYGIPSIESSIVDQKRFQVYINVKWLDRLNLKAPTDVDSLYQVLKAFKEQDANGNGNPNDEIPLMGSQRLSMGGALIDWLINLFVYYNRGAAFNVSDDGKLSTFYTSDEYREALKFVHKLYKEGLINDLAFTATATELKQYYTPKNGTTICGIILAHLSSYIVQGSELMYEYEPLDLYKYVIYNKPSPSVGTFITESCQNVDKAFEMMMLLSTEEGTRRMRYGEKGVNWDDADPGAVSAYGIPAAFKVLDDAFGQQNNKRWGKMPSQINKYAEGEDAQIDESLPQWQKDKIARMAKVEELYQKAMANTPKKVCPVLAYTVEEKEGISVKRDNVNSYWTAEQTKFCTDTLDPYSDADWNAYLAKLDELGRKDVLALAQTVYDRMMKAAS